MKYLNDEIITISKKLGFELTGFTKAEYLYELEKILVKQEKLGYKTSFQKGEIGEKTFKKSEYKSVIVFGLTYNKFLPNLKENEVYFSSVAVGKDYHIVLKDKLKFVKDYLIDNGYKAELFVDNNIYDERYLAFKAGLGFYGKNGLLINKKYGSYFYIGIVLTDAPFKYGKVLKDNCYKCNKCLKACPTKAINESNVLNGNKCLSYLTQQKEITVVEEEYMNSCVYGCDICSLVCPHNDNIPKSNNFKSEGIEIIKSDDFLNMSQEKYKKMYANNSSYWRGKKIIDRNINLSIQNKLKKQKVYDKI